MAMVYSRDIIQTGIYDSLLNETGIEGFRCLWGIRIWWNDVTGKTLNSQWRSEWVAWVDDVQRPGPKGAPRDRQEREEIGEKKRKKEEIKPKE